MLDLMETLSLLADQFADLKVTDYMATIFSGGDDTRQQVSNVVESGLDNLRSLGDSMGLDKWELLALVVLSAITVYRKELSSNRVYQGSDGKKERGFSGAVDLKDVPHTEDCQRRGEDGDRRCACAAVAEAAALAAEAEAAGLGVGEGGEDRKTGLRELVHQKLQSLNLPTNHLQQLHARLDSTWAYFSSSSATPATSSSPSASATASGSGLPPVAKGKVGVESEDGGERSSFDRAFSAPGALETSLPSSFVVFRQSMTANANARSSTTMTDDEGGKSRSEDGGEVPGEGAGQGQGQGTGQGQGEGDTTMAGWVEAVAAENAPGEAGAAAVTTAALKHVVRAGPERLPSGPERLPSGPERLPSDALQKVLEFLAAPDILSFGGAASFSYQAADEEPVWRSAWVQRFGQMWETDLCREAAARWHLHGWDPRSSGVEQGWKAFFSEFEATWLGWVTAGLNTMGACIVGLHGRAYDITAFVERHPGSPETLLDMAGTDATAFFEDVGHSTHARELMRDLPSIGPAPSPLGNPRRCILVSVAERLRVGQKRALEKAAVSRGEERPIFGSGSFGAGGWGRGWGAGWGSGGGWGTGGAWRAGWGGSEGSGWSWGSQGAGGTGEGVEEVRREDCQRRDGGDRAREGEGVGLGDGFHCLACEGSFHVAPRGVEEEGCGHREGSLRLFYIPTRAHWAGFYSCCREHMAFERVP